VFAAEFLIEDLNRPVNKQKSWIVLPYAFSSDNVGFTMGTVGIWHGYIQPQMTILATAFAGEKIEINHGTGNDAARTKGFVGGVSGYKSGFSERIQLFCLFTGRLRSSIKNSAANTFVAEKENAIK
jgi:hypothetical protein